ncbi:MAG: hypothetical protein COV33_01305 [Candidatus Zambryskibacteria bacterium CG10_big_fil_rev_8_21_14_0_10_34_34]|uniref:Magnesium transporter CorA n=1 Tax=Candidatus Zambryskibacteria bacterium CG10_big_fil_rev_8_21_14_0_10_34_34 TaxID=1975114 RepID=A0A2H0R0V6_9BACT|nr:MAG: hypothetical protein COV33_01305 [Candidatus Zambryskibacteria bacterium CG10_big_fil_rev_8_21_14_0_10_34_34]
MLTTHSFMNQIWTDLNSPTKEEVDSLVLTHKIDPLIAKDLLSPTPSQYIKDKDNFIYTVLHIPNFRHSHSENGPQEVDFIISKDSLITARYDSIDALHYFAKQIEVNEILNKSENSNVFFSMMKEIYKGLENELAYTEDWMKQIEEKIFKGQEKEMVFAISNVGRNLLNFRKTIDSHGNVFEFLRDVGTEKFGQDFGKQAKTLIAEWRQIMRVINNQIELITELRETNNSMLSSKQNEIMKIFTIMAFVTFPLSLIAGIFGMTTRYMPIVGQVNDFWIIIFIMLTISLAMFAYFRYKKWI